MQRLARNIDPPAPAPAPMGFATDSVAPAERFDAWRDRYRAMYEVIVPPDQRSAFAGFAEAWPLGEMMLVRGAAPARRLARTARDCALDGLAHWMLRVCRKGPLSHRSGDSAVRVEAGRLFIEALDQPSVLDCGEGPWVGLIVPQSVAQRWGLDIAAARQTGSTSPGPALLADFLLSLGDHLPFAVTDVARLAEATRAMLVACLPAGREQRSLSPEELALRQRAALDRIMRREIGSARLNVARLCALSGIPRSTLYRLYDGEGGVAATLRRMRLEKVHAALAAQPDQGKPIRQVAEQWGFHCTPSFNRAFQSAFGVTPGAVRRAATVASRTRRHEFEDWLRRA